MSTKFEFNLIRERWIPVVDSTGVVREVGLRECLAHAHEFRDLAISVPPEYAAVFRLLLTLMHRVYPGATDEGLTDDEWGRVFSSSSIDTRALDDYLAKWQHRFDLFDSSRPFFQVPEIRDDKGALVSRSPVALLAFDRASGNNATLFDHSVDGDPAALTPAAAARVLLAYQGYAAGGRIQNDKASRKGGLLRAGAQIYVVGNNLWQTLCLNLLGYHPWEKSHVGDLPAWESAEAAKSGERAPRGWLDALTWQARRVVLHPELCDGRVVVRAASSSGGWDSTSESPDPFVRRRLDSTGKMLLPVKVDEGRASWRSAASLYGAQDAGRDKRSAIVETVRWRRDLALIPDRVGESLRVVGLASDKSKVFLWRNEQLPLPLNVVADVVRLTAVNDGLVRAEKVWSSAVRFALMLVAEVVLSPNAASGGRKPRKEDSGALVATTPAESEYWARVGSHFEAWIRGLDANDLSATESWNKALRKIAGEAFVIGSRGFGEHARVWRGVAQGESALRSQLNKLIPAEGTEGS